METNKLAWTVKLIRLCNKDEDGVDDAGDVAQQGE
jgi:hypothetical protein